MKIAIHGKEFKRQSAPFIESIFKVLRDHRAEVFVSSDFIKHIKPSTAANFKFKTYRAGEKLKGVNFFISIGGDGTLLESVTHVGRTELPILGINTGRLGFLATISKEETEAALAKVFSGAYTLDERALLQLQSNQEIFGKLNFALNDFTVVKKDTSSMITIHTFINEEFLN